MPLFYLISLLPLSILYKIAKFLLLFNPYIIHYRNKIVLKNLQNSFPEKSEKEIKKIMKKFYERLLFTIVETIKAISMSKEDLKRRFLYENKHIIKEELKNNHVVILATHMYNWEWVLISNSIYFKNICFMYQKVSVPFFNRLLLKIRERFCAKGVERKKIIRFFLRNEKQQKGNQIILAASDQHPGALQDTSFFCDFLHQKTYFFSNNIKFFLKKKISIIYLSIKSISEGHFKGTFLPLVSYKDYEKKEIEHTEIAKKYAQLLEKDIRHAPHNWLWSHKRWK